MFFVIAGFAIIVIAWLYINFFHKKEDAPFESEQKPKQKYGARITFFGIAENGFTPVPYDGFVIGQKESNGLLHLTIEDTNKGRTKVLESLSWQDNIQDISGSNAGVGKVHWLCNKDWLNRVYPWNPVGSTAFLNNLDKVYEERIRQDERERLDEAQERVFQRALSDKVERVGPSVDEVMRKLQGR